MTKKEKGLPHARGGVSLEQVVEIATALVFPTLVGVFLRYDADGLGAGVSSPRSWGCFQESTLIQYFSEVFPTLVGVFPLLIQKHSKTR